MAKKGKFGSLVTILTTVGPIAYKFYKQQQAKKAAASNQTVNQSNKNKGLR